MRQYFADLHIHIGRAYGHPVKITASEKLTLAEVLEYGKAVKGLDILGVVDCGSPMVYQDIRDLLDQGILRQTANGDLMSDQGVMLVLGAETESSEGAHFISYLPNLTALEAWQKIMSGKIKNPNLSTQKAALQASDLLKITKGLDGIFVVAHAFTPHRGAYGCWVRRLADGFGPQVGQIDALELGLSSDTDMADLIRETRPYAFLSNSDAHSLPNIGREYNLMRLAEPSFTELKKALAGAEGRRVIANYGMHPKLGKYHRGYCEICGLIEDSPEPHFTCSSCGRTLITGVWDRIMEIRDYDEPHHPVGRPPYNYRVPLSFIPGIGPKTYQKLRRGLGTDIDILEKADPDLIEKLTNIEIKTYIKDMRGNTLNIIPGGGGKYGKIQINNPRN